MAETPSPVSSAIRPDGVVDFYHMLSLPLTAPTPELKQRIEALFTEANINRDHRNPAKRREYQMLLEELLPQARLVLLDTSRRTRYDSYLQQSFAGQAPVSYGEFIQELGQKSSSAEVADILGTQAAPTPPQPTPRLPAPKAQSSLESSLLSALGFFAMLLILMLLMHVNLPVSLLISAIVALVVWIVGHLVPAT